MSQTSSLVFAGIAPHPPIMVPEVGREACVDVQHSISAMAELTERLIAVNAETVVMISPHAPLEAGAFIAYEGPQLYGDFANFRAPTATIHAQLDEELLDEITRAASEDELAVLRIKGHDLDHGTAVPLYFLQRNGWQGRVIALGYSFLSNEDHVRFGRCVRKAIEKVGRSVAFIASGDLSHRLRRDAPAGYNPNAHLFDEEVVDAIRTSSTIRIVDIDHELRRLAGECGYRSMLVAIGVAQGADSNCEVISYEAPFGVGYLVAQLVSEPGAHAPAPSASGVHSDTKAIPALARRTVETFIKTGSAINPPADLPDLFLARAGCFVSIKTLKRDLRGCIGTIDPVKDTLAEEIIANAISAATMDPRFSPVRADELANLKYSVDILSAPEPTTLGDIDVRIHGVIVEDENHLRRGLLLPNLPGIDTAAKQVEIAARKAGISAGEPLKLFRFRAERYSE
ncbi:MAG TPA: AmmeMemoRadiSam system protein A [Pyrinomonadaceae bacterium]|nr:AmmeMemoRadiSam system protein A [Pyrinomonadaceae bacterium]